MDRNYTLVSTDGHCGASIQGYRDYLERRYLDEFDAWSSSYSDAWGAIDDAVARDNPEAKVGVSSFMSPVNWDSAAREAELKHQGIAAEVLFPNTVPPFQPSGSITTPGPTSAADYERRFAGLRAHNRWLAEFCQELPGRRAGIAQIYLNDVDDAVAEIRWAKEHGLMGVLLPGDHFHLLNNLYYPKLDPIWRTLVELDFPVHRHGVIPSEAASEVNGPAGPAVGLLESHHFAVRGIAHLVYGGVFERFPTLKFVQTENGCSWLPSYMRTLDQLVAGSHKPGSVGNLFGAAAFKQLSLKPSEYIKRNCWVGTFLTGPDMESRSTFNPDHVMWGADFPHHEGTSPMTTEALRINFADVSEGETRRILSENAGACYGFDLDQLQTIADQIGPSPATVHTPLPLSDYPRYPEDTVCPTFVMADNFEGFAPGVRD